MYEIIRIIFSVKADILQKSVEDKWRQKKKTFWNFLSERETNAILKFFLVRSLNEGRERERAAAE